MPTLCRKMHAQTLKKQGKHEEMQRSKLKVKVARLPSSPTRHGEQKKQEIGRSTYLLAMASIFTREASEGGLTPQADVAENHQGRKLNSPWRINLLARRVETGQANIKGHLFISKEDHRISQQNIRSHLRPPEEERKQGKTQREPQEQGAQELKEDTRSVRHHGLDPFHFFFSPCKVTMTMSN